MDKTRSTFLSLIRKTAKRMQTVSGVVWLSLGMSWVPWRTIGEGVLSSSPFGALVTLSTELPAAELSSAKEEK